MFLYFNRYYINQNYNNPSTIFASIERQCHIFNVLERIEMKKTALLLIISNFITPYLIYAQSISKNHIEKWGNFDNWVVREIKESAIIGGKTKYLYEIAPKDTIHGNVAYVNPHTCVWSTSNVLAIVMKIVKTSCTVFPEKRGDGYCARLETRVEDVRVLGMIDLHVLASGTVYLGVMHEPIKDTKNPQSKLSVGIPYTDKPSGISFDYKAIIGNKRIKAAGMGAPKVIGDRDYGECVVMLQKRWEDSKGNVYAKRIGTGFYRFSNSSPNWINNHFVKINYGNITSEDYYKPYMRLIPKELSNYTTNSKGVSVPINEIEWGNSNDTPTHIIIRFSSSYGDAYIGDPVNKLWIDNVKIVN